MFATMTRSRLIACMVMLAVFPVFYPASAKPPYASPPVLSGATSNDSDKSDLKNSIENAARKTIRSVVKVLGAGAPGSGVIVRKIGTDYVVLTAAHVIRGLMPNDITGVVTSDGIQHTAKRIEISPWLDLAIIWFSSNVNYLPITKVSAEPSSGEYAVVLGYSLGSNRLEYVPAVIESTSSDLSIRPGGYVISYFTRIPVSSSWNWQSSTSIGMSGGPVIDLDGRLIAIHGEADLMPRRKIDEHTVGSGSGLSLGIPAAIWGSFGDNLTSLTEERYYQMRGKPGLLVDDLVLKAEKIASEGSLAEAIALYSQAILIDPDSASLYGNRALKKEMIGDLKGALSDYSNAIRIRPNDWQSLSMRGALRSRLGDHSGAQEDFLASFSLNNDYFRAIGLSIRDLLVSRRVDEAIQRGENYRNSVNPRSDGALFVGRELANAYIAGNRFQESLLVLQDLSSHHPRDVAVRLMIYQLYADHFGRPLEGLSFLRKDLPMFSSSRDYLYALSVAELDYGRSEAAVSLLDRLTFGDSRNPRLLQLSCYALYKAKRLQDALEKCQASIQLDPRSALSYRYQGLVLGDLGRHEEAINSYTTGIQLSNPRSAIDFLNRGEALWVMGRRRDACSDFRKGLMSNVVERQNAAEMMASWKKEFVSYCAR